MPAELLQELPDSAGPLRAYQGGEGWQKVLVLEAAPWIRPRLTALDAKLALVSRGLPLQRREAAEWLHQQIEDPATADPLLARSSGPCSWTRASARAPGPGGPGQAPEGAPLRQHALLLGWPELQGRQPWIGWRLLREYKAREPAWKFPPEVEAFAARPWESFPDAPPRPFPP